MLGLTEQLDLELTTIVVVSPGAVLASFSYVIVGAEAQVP
jgi:hypothetical protein